MRAFYIEQYLLEAILAERFPIFLCLKQRACLVVGGGRVASRKTERLLQSGAQVTLIAPDILPELLAVLQQYPSQASYQADVFRDERLDGQFLAIAATNDPALNAHIAQCAQAKNILVNVADNPDAGHFILPSVVERAPVQIAISTGGASPVLARQLRLRLDTLVPAAYGQLAALTERYRERVKQHFPTPEQRKRFWEQVLNGSVAELAYAGQLTAAQQWLDKLLAQQDATPPVGEVYLVGAGPGDPDLLTLRALRLMQQAEVVLYDRLVARSIVDMVNPDAERLYVGKVKSHHAVPQTSINDLLVELAQQGKRVLRLKGGDPFIFGRGGEEIESLAQHHIPFQVVPGITAASGCAAYAGIPLTHRDYAQSCIFTTGHLKNGTLDLDWNTLARPG